MSIQDKIVFALLGVFIFITAGGIASTYSTTNAINPILTGLLVVLVFITVGGIACTYGSKILAKRKAIQVTR
jgi:lipopolysaccharide export LptBFGC system permease protein LptF